VYQELCHIHDGLKKCFQSSAVVITLFTGVSLATPGLAQPCTGAGAPSTTETKCLTAVQIPGKPLRAFDISWVNPNRSEYYLSDRSNAGIDIIFTATNTFLPPAQLRSQFDAVLAFDKKIITYCGGGIAASATAHALVMLGHPDVRLYDASMSEWSNDPSLPMETGE